MCVSTRCIFELSSARNASLISEIRAVSIAALDTLCLRFGYCSEVALLGWRLFNVGAMIVDGSEVCMVSAGVYCNGRAELVRPRWRQVPLALTLRQSYVPWQLGHRWPPLHRCSTGAFDRASR
jgi:hypothetical protein